MLNQREARKRLPKELEQVKSATHYKQDTTAPRNWSKLRVPGTINKERLAQERGQVKSAMHYKRNSSVERVQVKSAMHYKLGTAPVTLGSEFKNCFDCRESQA